MDVLSVYTDGACIPNPGKGSWAWVVDNSLDVASGFELETTNNRMEMLAVIEAIQSLSKPNRVLNIKSDSMLLVNGVNAWMPSWKNRGWKKKKGDIKNIDLWLLLDETISQSKSIIDISWVRGHSGIQGNERADMLALETLRFYSKDCFTTSSRYSSRLTAQYS